MKLLDLLNKKSEFLRLKVYRGDAWAEHFEEFQELLARGDISIERVKDETVIVVRQEFTNEEIDNQIKGCLRRYSKWGRKGVHQAFDIFQQLRKRGVMSNKAFLRTLRSWEAFSKTSVEYGVRQYIRISEKEKHTEAYCTGIIRVIDQRRQYAGGETPQQERVRNLKVRGEDKERLGKIEFEQTVNRLFAERGGENMDLESAKLLLMGIKEEVTARLAVENELE